MISWIIVGLIAGAIAKMIHPGEDPGGWIASLIIGLVGSMVGGWVFSLVGFSSGSGLNLYSILVAVVGAVICLALYRRFA